MAVNLNVVLKVILLHSLYYNVFCFPLHRAIYESLWETVRPTPDKDAKPSEDLPPQAAVKTYKIGDFQLLKVLGKGSFGKVSKVDKLIISTDE